MLSEPKSGIYGRGNRLIPMVIDRLNREREYGELRCEKPVVEYFNSGRFYVGCEGSEGALSYVVNLIGLTCMFASDFPHEIAMENALDESIEIRT